MKLALNITNPSMLKHPSSENVILCDGKSYYVTTKQDLFREYEEKIAKLEEDYANFLADYTEQNSKLIALIESLMSEKEGE